MYILSAFQFLRAELKYLHTMYPLLQICFLKIVSKPIQLRYKRSFTKSDRVNKAAYKEEALQPYHSIKESSMSDDVINQKSFVLRQASREVHLLKL